MSLLCSIQTTNLAFVGQQQQLQLKIYSTMELRIESDTTKHHTTV